MPTLPALFILILSPLLPIAKVILFPVFALIPKFPVLCHIVFPVSLPLILKPPINELKFPVVIAPLLLTLPELSILNVFSLLELL